jgi:hypothetical protein
VQIYKGYMEYVLRSKWDKPDDMADDNYVVEISMSVWQGRTTGRTRGAEKFRQREMG